jgi:hypothetical protein
MTLAQIRDLVRANEPSLERVLEIQVRAWRTKKSDAERGLLLAHAALKRVQSQESLSIDAMCNLIRGLEMSDQLTVVRNYVQENLTPDEVKAVTEFMTRGSDLEMIKAKTGEQAAVFRKLRKLMEAGTSPESDEVQKLLAENIQIEASSGTNERMLKTIEWNAGIAINFYSVKWKQLRNLREQPAADDPQVVFSPKVWDFYLKASKHSPSAQPMMNLMIDFSSLMAVNPDPGSPQAQALVKRYRDLYHQYSLGNPDAFARLVPYMEAIHDGWPEWMGEDAQAVWMFLSQAVTDSCEGSI